MDCVKIGQARHMVSATYGGTVSASNAPGGAGGGLIVEIKLPVAGAVS